MHSIVGREHELADLGHRLAAARDRDGSVVLVDGEPGMGKTALAGELMRRARRDGMATSWGACLEGEGAGAYRPWIQILGGVAPEAQKLLASTGDSRFRIFDEVVAALRAASAVDGMLVVLDDLHWADVPSMRLLQVLAPEVAESRMLVLGLYRGAEVFPRAELAAALPALLRERTASQLTLGRLEPADVEQLATQTLRRAPDAGLLTAVENRAEGNPLFVVELLRLVEMSGRADHALPGGIREVIGRRLDRVPDATRHALRAAAVLGRDFAVGALAEVLDEPPACVVERLDHAIAANLVTDGDGPSVWFVHALVQEVAYGELPGADRQRLHQRAAQALGEAPHLVDSVAHHLRQAVALGGAEPALAATLRAARRANGQLAYEHAAFQYRQALDLPAQLGRRQQLLLELARCEFRAGAVRQAWESCRAAADLGRAEGDAATVAEAATIVRGLATDPIRDEIHALCREALALLDGADPVLEARLLGQLAVTSSPWAGGIEEGLSQRALLAAEATGDPDARFLALQARLTDLADFRYSPERLSIGERAVQLGRETGRDDYRAWGHAWRIDAFWELSRRVQLDTELAALTGVVAHLKEPLAMWRLKLIQASLALSEGRHADASALADEALVIGRRGGHSEADFMHVVFRSHLAPLVGDDMADVEQFVRRFAQEGPFLARNWHMKTLADMGRLDEAAAMWTSVLSNLDAFPRYVPEWIANLVGIADLCVRFGKAASARAMYADLLPFADRQAVAKAHTPSLGPVALHLGRLALLLEDWDAAGAHLGTALHLSATMGSPLFEAKTRVDLARLLLARRRPTDVRDADAHLEAAVAIAKRLGLAPLESEATTLLAARRGGRSSPLSSREEEVAALVAKGLSNRVVASRLHLSERTVEAHVRSIFNKLGFDSRASIAAWHASRTPED